MDPNSFAKIQRALAEPNRLEILEIIRSTQPGDCTNCGSVLAKTNVSQSTFSHHISELVEAGLVIGEKQGRAMRLSVNQELVEEYLSELKSKILGKK